MTRPAVDLQPNGKWRVGSTIGNVPKNHDCIIEGFIIKKGKTQRIGKVTYVPNNGGQPNYIFRNNDISN